MRRALDELLVVRSATSQAFHRRVADDPVFRVGPTTSDAEHLGMKLLESLPAEHALAAPRSRSRASTSRLPQWRCATAGSRRRECGYARAPSGPMTTVRIHGIATGGDVLGRLADGVTVFVPRTAPGDVVEIDLTERRPRVGGASAAWWNRVACAVPVCPHYEADACGGARSSTSLRRPTGCRRTIVRDLVERVDAALDQPDVVAARSPWHIDRRSPSP
jgi:predicted RNA-binding protein with TRAM domain